MKVLDKSIEVVVVRYLRSFVFVIYHYEFRTLIFERLVVEGITTMIGYFIFYIMMTIPIGLFEERYLNTGIEDIDVRIYERFDYPLIIFHEFDGHLIDYPT